MSVSTVFSSVSGELWQKLNRTAKCQPKSRTIKDFYWVGEFAYGTLAEAFY